MDTFSADLLRPITPTSINPVLLDNMFLFGTEAPLESVNSDLILSNALGMAFDANGLVCVDDDKYLSTPDVAMTDKLSILTRIKVTDTGRFQGVIGKSTGTDNWCFNLYIRDNNELAFLISTSAASTTAVKFDYTPYLNEFHEVAATYDGTKLRLYIDGILVNTETHTTGGNIHNSPDEISIGAYLWSGGKNDLGGSIEYLHYDVNRVLDIDEIAQVAQDPYGIFETLDEQLGEYQLVIPEARYETSNQHLTFTPLTNASKECSLEFKCAWTEQYGSIRPEIVGTTSGADYIVFSSTTNLRVYLQYSAYDFTLPSALQPDVKYVFKITLTGGVLTAYQDATELVGTVTGVTKGIKLEAGTLFSGTESYSAEYFRFISNDFPADSRAWSFNRTYGNKILDDTNGKPLTLVNFPEAMGAVRAFGVSDGLQFNGVDQNVIIPDVILSGDFNIVGNCTYNDATEVMLGVNENANHYVASIAGNGLRFKLNNNTSTFVTGIPDGEDIEWELSRVGDTATLTVIGHGSTSINVIGDITFNSIGSYNSNTLPYAGGFKFLVFDNSRYYDFTRITDNTILPETINGEDGMLVNFNDVYIPEKNKVLVGQYLESTSKYTIFPEWVGNSDFTLVLKLHKGEDTSEYRSRILGSMSTGSFTLQIEQDLIRFGIYGLTASTINVDGYVGELTLTLTRTGNEYKLVCDELAGEALKTTGEAIKFNVLGRAVSSTEGYKGLVQSLSIVGGSHDTYLDFTQEAGSTIVDTSGNDNHGQVVGGELRRVYDYSGYGEIVGFKVPKNKQITLPEGWLVGTDDIDVTIDVTIEVDPNDALGWRYLIDSTNNANLTNRSPQFTYSTAINKFEFGLGNGTQWIGIVSSTSFPPGVRHKVRGTYDGTTINLYVDGVLEGTGTQTGVSPSSMGTILVDTESVTWHALYDKDRNYDFTTGDISLNVGGSVVPAIKETIGGYHAAIVNPETSGFMPVLEKFTFTANADGTADYIDVTTFITDRKGDDSRIDHLHLEGDFVGNQYLGSNLIGNFIIQGHTPSDGGKNFEQQNKLIAESGIDYALQLSTGTSGSLQLLDLALDCRALTADERAIYIANSNTFSVLINGVYSKVPSSNTENYLHYFRNNSTDLSKFTVKNSCFDAEGKTSGFFNVVRSVNDATYINVIAKGGPSNWAISGDFTNCVFTGNYIDNNSTGSNNFHEATTNSAATQLDFTNAFNLDGTIEQSWAEVNLLGTGWHGSNVVQWAWSDAVAADVTGTLIVQLGEVQTTSQALHGVNITGTVLAQLQDDLLNGLGSVGATITGVLAEQLGNNIPNYDAIYGSNIVGTLAELLDNDVSNSIAVHGNSITGSLSETHEDVTPSYVGVFGNSVTGALSINLDENIPSYIGTVGAVIIGTLGEQLGDITSNLTGVVGQNITGTLGVNLEVNLPAYSAVLEQPNPSATLATILFDNTATSDALHGNNIVGNLSETHGDNEPSYFGTVGDVISGALSSLLESGVASYNAQHGNAITGNASIFMEGIDLSANAVHGSTITGTVNVVLEEDTLNGIIAYGAITGSLGIVSQDVALDALAALGILLVGNNDVGVTATFDYLDLHFSIALVAADINLSSTLA